MRDGIFCSLRRLLSFMKMRNTYAKSTQMLRKFSSGHLAMSQMIGCQRTQFLCFVVYSS